MTIDSKTLGPVLGYRALQSVRTKQQLVRIQSQQLMLCRMIKEANRHPLHAMNVSLPSRNRNTPVAILIVSCFNLVVKVFTGTFLIGIIVNLKNEGMMALGLEKISRRAAEQAVTPMGKRVPKTKRELALKYTHLRVNVEVDALKEKLDRNKNAAFLDGEKSLLQRIKLIIVDALDLLKTAVRVSIVGLRYFSGVIIPSLVFGDAELSEPPGF